jgi:hypothetical protein
MGPSYVSKLISQGLVVLSTNGKLVDVEASDQRIAQARSVDRQGLREHHARNRLASAIDPRSAGAGESAPYPLNGAAAPPQGAAAPTDSATPPAGASSSKRSQGDNFDLFNKARADKETELAQLAKLERLEREGALVDTQSVKVAAGRVAAAITQGLDQMAPRLASKLAAESDERKCALLIDEAVRNVREDLAREIEKIVGVEAGDASA